MILAVTLTDPITTDNESNADSGTVNSTVLSTMSTSNESNPSPDTVAVLSVLPM